LTLPTTSTTTLAGTEPGRAAAADVLATDPRADVMTGTALARGRPRNTHHAVAAATIRSASPTATTPRRPASRRIRGTAPDSAFGHPLRWWRPPCPRSNDQPNRGSGPGGDGDCPSLPVGGTSSTTSEATVVAGSAGAERLTSGSHPGLGPPVPVGEFAGSANSARTRAATRARSPPRQPMPALPESPTGVTLSPVGLLAARAGSAVDNGNGCG
jgi:hypothetical protein